jgi:hypothetical protein
MFLQYDSKCLTWWLLFPNSEISPTMDQQRNSFDKHVQTIILKSTSKLIPLAKLDRVKQLCDGLPCVWTGESSGPRNEAKFKHWVASKGFYTRKLIGEDASKVIMKHKPQVSY